MRRVRALDGPHAFRNRGGARVATHKLQRVRTAPLRRGGNLVSLRCVMRRRPQRRGAILSAKQCAACAARAGARARRHTLRNKFGGGCGSGPPRGLCSACGGRWRTACWLTSCKAPVPGTQRARRKAAQTAKAALLREAVAACARAHDPSATLRRKSSALDHVRLVPTRSNAPHTHGGPATAAPWPSHQHTYAHSEEFSARRHAPKEPAGTSSRPLWRHGVSGR